MQVQGGGAGTTANVNVLSDSPLTAMRQIIKREGVRSLFNGIIPTFAKVLPAVAIGMTVTKELIGKAKEWEN